MTTPVRPKHSNWHSLDLHSYRQIQRHNQRPINSKFHKLSFAPPHNSFISHIRQKVMTTYPKHAHFPYKNIKKTKISPKSTNHFKKTKTRQTSYIYVTFCALSDSSYSQPLIFSSIKSYTTLKLDTSWQLPPNSAFFATLDHKTSS